MKKMFGPKDVKADRLRALRLEAVRQIKNVILDDEVHKFTIKDVQKGGFIAFDEKHYRVDDTSTYQESNDKFTKLKKYKATELTLFCIETGEVVYLEWDEEDGLNVYLTTQEIRFSDLKDDRGSSVDEDDLDPLCDEEDCIYYNGKRFDYEDDWPAIYTPAGGEIENVYFYDLEASDGTCMTVEEWDPDTANESYQIFISQLVDSQSIQIISLEG